MGKKLENAPLYFTVAQIQFNPILNLDNYLPAIQAKMRDANFPDYRQDVSQRLVFPMGSPDITQPMSPTVTLSHRHAFGNLTGTTNFLLESNVLSFFTSEYDTFTEFSTSFFQALLTVHEAIGLSFVERVGLRYLNAVQVFKGGESLSEYLVPEVLGLSQRVKGTLIHSVSETVSTLDAGQVIARVIIRDDIVGVPPELIALNPKINPKFTHQKGLHAILDTDSSYINREPYDFEKIKKRFDLLHDEIEKSFQTIATPYALKQWA